MGLSDVFKNIEAFADKIKDSVEKNKTNQSTIMHPEVYKTKEEAEKASKDMQFRSFYSAKREAGRRLSI